MELGCRLDGLGEFAEPGSPPRLNLKRRHTMHPLFTLATQRPQLLLDHAAAYTHLAHAELSGLGARAKRQALLAVAAGLLFSVALVLAGMSLMLFTLLEAAARTSQAQWVLWRVPAVPTLGAAACALLMRNSVAAGAVNALKAQWRADVALWQEMSAR